MSGLSLDPVAVPLHTDASGVIRIANTRVLLEVVIRAFQNGAAPEAIVQSYDTLTLPDVYAVLAYYLSHQDEIDTYMKQCEEQAGDMRRQIENSQPARPNLRELLLKRAKAAEESRASAAD